MSVKHTPGPWQVSHPKGGGVCRTIWRNDEGPDSKAETNTNYALICRDVISPADAKLIAAAPAMLKALKDLMFFCEGMNGKEHWLEPWQAAREAIEAAE